MSQALGFVRQAPVRPLAAPFLKWAGGKGRLLPQLLPLTPARFGRYFEPFVGGGAMFFALAPRDAILADKNPELVAVYRCVRDDLDALVADLGRHRHERAYYYAVRGADPRRMSPVQRASRMLYLNRTCFNGLYRVNRRGEFNVPFGDYKNPDLCPADRLAAASAVLSGARVEHADYAEVLAEAGPGDFVYLDPPYHPVSRTANFTRYCADDFGEDDQRRLAATVADLDRRGVRLMLSNSDTPFVRELYAGLRIETIEAPRAISRRGDGRGPVSEVVVLNY